MAEITRYIKHRRDTAANWTSNNPILKAGQLGIETDGLTTIPKFKIGDGVTAWTALPYFYGGASSAQNLNNVLGVGNTTGGANVVVSDDDIIQVGSTANRKIGFNTSTIVGGLELVNLNSNDHIILQDAGGIHIDTTYIQVPQVTASRILSTDASNKITGAYTTTGSGTELALSTQPTFSQWLTVPRIYGGTGVNDGIDFYSTSGNGTSSSTAHRFVGGNNGGTTILTMLNDGTIRIPNNRVIQGTDSGGANRSLIVWSSGDNITITGRPGATDINLNPTSGGIGLYVKSGGDGGIGVASPAARWHIIKTSEQLRVGYDTSNYMSTSIASNGEVTNTLVGTTRNFNFSSAGSMSIRASSAVVTSYLGSDGGGGYVGTSTAHAFRILAGNTQRLSFASGTGACTVADGLNFTFNTTTGSKLGTATTEKLAFWNATPIVQPTTAVAAATLVGGGGTALTETDTFDGYTLKQIVKALRNTGLLA